MSNSNINDEIEPMKNSMKRTGSAKLIGNGYKPSIYNSNKDNLYEDKPLNLSNERNKKRDSSPFNTKSKDIFNTSSKKVEATPRKSSIKKMNNTEFNNLRFEAAPSENKKILKRSSTNNSLDIRSSFKNNNNIDVKSSVNNLDNLSNIIKNTDLEKLSPTKSAYKTPTKGKINFLKIN